MKFTVAAVAAFAGVAAAGFANVTTVTIPCEITTSEIVTAYTTYCPEPTTIVENTKTYTITKAGTVTITDCPCTRTKVQTTTTTTVCPVSSGTPVLPSTVTPITTITPPASSATGKTVTEECHSCTKKSVAPQNTTVPTTSVPQVNGAASFGVSGAVAGALAAAVYFL